MEPTDGAELSPRARRDSLTAIIASTFGVGVNLGVLTPLVALILERDGVDAILIGLNAAMPALAMLLWGGLIGSFYTPTLALLGQSFATGDLAVANAAFILACDLGGAAGPVLGGAALDLWDPHGLPLAVGLALAAFLLFAASHRNGGERA